MSSPRQVLEPGERPRALTVMNEISVETPVWDRPYGTGYPLDVPDLVDLGLPPELVQRLVAWNEWCWEGFGSQDRSSRRSQPGREREVGRLAREMQALLPDIDVIVFNGYPTRPFRDDGLPEGDRPVDADRPTAVTVMAAPTIHDPLLTTPFGRCTVVDAEALFVTPELVARLRVWNAAFPGPDRLDEQWCATGLALARELQDELWDVAVHYFEDDDPRPVRERRR